MFRFLSKVNLKSECREVTVKYKGRDGGRECVCVCAQIPFLWFILHSRPVLTDSPCLCHLGFLEPGNREFSWGGMESASSNGFLLFAQMSQLVVRDCHLHMSGLMCLRVSMSISVKEPSVPCVQMCGPSGWEPVKGTRTKQSTGVSSWLYGAFPTQSQNSRL